MRIVNGDRIGREIAAPFGGGQGLDASGAGRRANPKLLESSEREQLVLQDRTSQCEAGLVALELVLSLGEEVAGIERGIADEPESVAVDPVGAGFGDHIDSARSTVALLHPHVGGFY